MKPLPTPNTWHSRWWWNDDEHPHDTLPFQAGEATSVCDVRAVYEMPGVISRMGLKRCSRCCRKLGIPRGHGAPYNDATLTPEQGEA